MIRSTGCTKALTKFRNTSGQNVGVEWGSVDVFFCALVWPIIFPENCLIFFDDLFALAGNLPIDSSTKKFLPKYNVLLHNVSGKVLVVCVLV